MDNQPITVINLGDERLRRQATSSKESVKLEWLAAEAKATPITPETAIRLLTPCLALCAPSGMTEADRTEWLTAAYGALAKVPGSLFESACHEAKLACDHPAKIVPFIAKTTASHAESLIWLAAHKKHQYQNWTAPRLAAPRSEPVRDLEPITQEEVNSLPLFLRQSWLNLGMITQEQFDGAWASATEAT